MGNRSSNRPSTKIELKPGHLLKVRMRVRRQFFRDVDHYAIYVGDEKVVHRKPTLDGTDGCVEICSIEDYKKLSMYGIALAFLTDPCAVTLKLECTCKNGHKRNTPEFIAERALQRVGEKGFDYKTNNSEHFVNWCIFGEDRSNQWRDAYSKYSPWISMLTVTLLTLSN